MHKISPLLIAFLCIVFPAFSQTTYYVDATRADNSGAGTSWATAKKDLQVAINGAAANDNIWIKAGTYLPTHDPFGSTAPANNRDKTFMLKSGVKVYGGFAGTETQLSQRNWQTNVTTLSGDLGVVNTLTDNAYHVVLSINLASTSLLDGVTITKGYALSPSTSITVNTRVIYRFMGAGVFNNNSGTVFNNVIVRGNHADCTDGNDSPWGAGVVNVSCTSSFTNCLIDGNTFPAPASGWDAFGTGMMISGGGCTINNCAIVNNTAGAFFNGSNGGGIYIASSTTTTVTNTLIANNAAQNGAGISVAGANNTPLFANCTIANNTSSYAGTGYNGFSKGTFRNCIFWNNAPTSSPIAGRNELASLETNPANQPSFINCIIREFTGTAPLNTITTTCIGSDPVFSSYADTDGADNVFMTGDDGLRLTCTSPAINTGTGATPTVDILNLPRTGAPDIGAYEGGHSSAAFNAIPTVNSTVQLAQNASGTTHYSNCSNKLVEIQSGGTYTLSGTVTAKVWIETVQPSKYVKRHYEITPSTNASTATARVTLYFTQQEFTDFNAVNAYKLPTGPGDAAGIANIKIEKRAGTSTNGTGLPNTYPGAGSTISSGSLSTLWNATAARWEISFDVAGFSGFFVKTQTYLLPLRLVDFSVLAGASCNKLQWQTADELNTQSFEIEKSTDGITYYSIGTRTAIGNGNNRYQFNDCAVTAGKVFYRLRMTDLGGGFTYSPVINIDRRSSVTLSISPNPVTDVAVISSNDISLMNTIVKVTDAGGRLVQQGVVTSLPHSLNVRKLPRGLYYVQFANGTTLKMIK